MSRVALVAGGGLEALAGALRLAEGDARVRVLVPGEEELPLLAGGLGVLGPEAPGDAALAADPFALVARLDAAHPLRRVGAEGVCAAMAWFLAALSDGGQAWTTTGANVALLTMTGRPVPAYAHPRSAATMPQREGGVLAVAQPEGFPDLAGHLLAAALHEAGHDAQTVPVALPGAGGSAMDCALALDTDAAGAALAERLRESLPDGVRCVLFPAALGVDGHARLVERLEAVLGAVVREVPTLPPSVQGLRLHRALVRALGERGAEMSAGVGPLRAAMDGQRCTGLRDGMGRLHEADVVLLATGGVLAGGLEVDSRGSVHEPILGARVHPTAPLEQSGAEAVADALHRAGLLTDDALRPATAGGTLQNVHAAGGLLPHANPVAERSAEGIAVATAVAAADHALAAGRPARAQAR